MKLNNLRQLDIDQPKNGFAKNLNEAIGSRLKTKRES